jgi:hypothetical protein
MNKQEILSTLRRLATDLSELQSSDVLKSDTYQLLDHASDEAGGVLVRWFNSEGDPRTKALLRAAIQIVVRAGVKHENVQANGSELLKLVERLENKPKIPETGDSFEMFCALNPTSETFTHADRARAFKRSHPEVKKTEQQLKRKSEEMNSRRRKIR